MSFGERIKFRRGELKLSRGELAGRLGVSPSAVSNYENGLSFPKEDVMLRLFDSLETDPNQLFRDSFRGGGQALSSEEQTLLRKFRELSPLGRETVQSVTEALWACRQETSPLPAERPEGRIIPLYHTLAAAGCVSAVPGEDFDEISVTEQVPQTAEFAVRISGDAMAPYLEDGAVVLDGGMVVEAGPLAQMRAKYPQAEFVDARGGVIMPGLINVHTHIYSGLARGLAIDGFRPTNFFEVLDGQWWNIDRHLTLDGTRACAYATVLDCIRDGVTTIFDHHASFGEIPGSLFAIKDVCHEVGIRANLCYEVSERDGAEKCAQAIRENAEFARWARDEDDDMIRAMFGGHALFTISDKTFEEMVRANDGMTGFHIHVAEGMNDVYDSLRNYGCRPVNRLLYNGILGEKTMLGHCIHISPAEMDILRETGTMVCHNPESNMGNAVGCSPVLQLYARGILLGLGTDAYTHDMLESLKVLLPMQRHNACDPNVGWCEAMGMLFRNNPAICARYFQKPLGVLEPGAAADVIVMDYKPFTPFSAENIDGHMLFGMMGKNCRTTIINGKLVYRDREFVGIDEDRINAWCLEQSKKLWGRLNHRAY